MTTKQKLAVWLGSLAMLAAWHVPAEAAVTCRALTGGLQKCNGSVWSNEIAPDQPVLQFPRGCAQAGTCQFSVLMDFVPGVPDPTCVPDDPTLPHMCDVFPTCEVRAHFGLSILPLSSNAFTDGQPGIVIGRVQDDGFREKITAPVQDNSNPSGNWFFGRDNQVLWYVGAISIYAPLQLCRIELTAFYHQDSRAVHNRGLLGP